MKTYNVQKRVETEKTTEIFEKIPFKNLKFAESKFNEILKLQKTYAGEFNDSEFSDYYKETLEIESFNDETGDFETIKENLVYLEGTTDKNNYRGDNANNYWTIAKHNGIDLIYNFYDNSQDLNLEYPNIKEKDLSKWFNYKR